MQEWVKYKNESIDKTRMANVDNLKKLLKVFGDSDALGYLFKFPK